MWPVGWLYNWGWFWDSVEEGLDHHNLYGHKNRTWMTSMSSPHSSIWDLSTCHISKFKHFLLQHSKQNNKSTNSFVDFANLNLWSWEHREKIITIFRFSSFEKPFLHEKIQKVLRESHGSGFADNFHLNTAKLYSYFPLFMSCWGGIKVITLYWVF